MAQVYKMVRLREKTHLALVVLAELWATLVPEGKMRPLRTTDDGMVSLDAVVEELVQRDWEHRQRASKNSSNRRAIAEGKGLARWSDAYSPQSDEDE